MEDSGDRSQIGAQLETSRRAARRSLRAVAQAAGISAGYLQKLERNQVASPSPKILQRLAVALEISYEGLMEASGYELPAARGTRSTLDGKLADASLSAAEQRAVAAFVDHLLASRTDA